MAKNKKSAEFSQILLYGVIVVALILLGYYASKQIGGSSAAGNIPLGNSSPTVGTTDVTVSLDPTSPKSMIVLAGTQNNEVARFRLRAVNEAFTVQTLTLVVPDTTDQGMTVDGWDSVKLLTIQYPNKMGQLVTKNVAPYGISTKFTGLDLYVPKNGMAMMTVKAAFYQINTESADFGDRIKIGFASGATKGDFSAVGMDTGKIDQLAAPTKAPIYAAQHVLYQSKPIIINQISNGIIIPGAVVDLYKFKVSADSEGSIAIKSFAFVIQIHDATTPPSPNADLTNFTILRDTVDITNSAQITNLSNDGNATPVTLESINYIEAGVPTQVQVAFGNLPATGGEEVVLAGSTVTYTLRAQCGNGFNTGDEIITTPVFDASEDPRIGYVYLTDYDPDLDVQQKIGLQKSNGVQNWLVTLSFVWSDLSGIAHNSSFDDDGVIETSSADWTQGYLVPGLNPYPWYLKL